MVSMKSPRLKMVSVRSPRGQMVYVWLLNVEVVFEIVITPASAARVSPPSLVQALVDSPVKMIQSHQTD